MSQDMKNLVMIAAVFSLTTMAAGIRAEDAEPAAASPQIARSQVDRSSVQWIEKEKIRAAYMHRWSDPAIPVKVGAAGFNTLHIQFCNGGYGDIERWSLLAHENGLRFVTGLWWSYPPHRETNTGQASGIGQRYRGFVHASGRTLTRTVCPIDQAYWADWVMPGFIEMAKRAKEAAIYAIALDPEFYGSEEPDGGGNYGWYNWAGACYCDHCFGGFARGVDAAVSPADVPTGERAAWVQQRNKDVAYVEYLKTKVQTHARQIE